MSKQRKINGFGVMFGWLCAFLMVITSVEAQIIRFSDFADVSRLTLNGDAQHAGAVLRLTPDVPNKRGSAFLTSPISLKAGYSFHTTFQFQIGGAHSGDPQGADGLAFVMHNDPRGALAIGNEGASEGFGIDSGWVYPTSPKTPISPSIAIEFDTHINSFDPSDNCVAVIRNGDVRTHVAVETPEFILNNGVSRFVWVDYNGNTGLLEVFISENSAKPVTPLLTLTLNLFTTLGKQIFCGFTGGTGGGFNCHDVLSWTLSN
jgi:hypothetical protein